MDGSATSQHLLDEKNGNNEINNEPGSPASGTNSQKKSSLKPIKYKKLETAKPSRETETMQYSRDVVAESTNIITITPSASASADLLPVARYDGPECSILLNYDYVAQFNQFKMQFGKKINLQINWVAITIIE